MKKITRLLCVVFALTLAVFSFTSCKKETTADGNNKDGYITITDHLGNVVDVPTNLSATESLTLSSDSPDDMGTGVTWTIEMGSVGTDKTVWHRVDTTKPKSDPEYETIWEQEEDGTLKRIR